MAQKTFIAKTMGVMLASMVLSSLFLNDCRAERASAAPVKTVGSSFHVYAGLMGGWERLAGRRTEIVTTAALTTLAMSDNFTMKQNNINAYGFFGKSIPLIKRSMTLTLSPEIYAGQGYGSATLRDQKDDVILGAPSKYRGDFRRTSSYGMVLKLGLEFLPTYSLYILGGYDKSRYQHRVDYISDPAGNPGFNGQYRSKHKWMSAPVFGVGFEKTIGCFKVGLEIRRLSPSTFRHVHSVGDAANPEFVDVRIKPKIYSTMLRLSYTF